MGRSKTKESLQNPAWVTYLSPFKLIVPNNEEPLKVELQEINENTYDHGKLCKIVSKLKIEGFDFDLLICYDGALAIPKFGVFSEKEKAVDFFNNLFCMLLIGGIYCEAIDQRDVVNGRLYKKKLIWPVDFGQSASTHLHSKLRMRVAGNFDSIILSNPKFMKVREFHDCVSIGGKILKQIPNLTSKFLIRGITEIKYKNWDLVLSNLWITVEQLIDFIWNDKFLRNNSFHPNTPIDGRNSSLKEDNRTWSTSVKQEILFQAKLIDEEIISKLFPARRARNKLIHEGRSVQEHIALDLFDVIKLLLSKYVNDQLQSFKIDIDSFNSRTDTSKSDSTIFTDSILLDFANS